MKTRDEEKASLKRNRIKNLDFISRVKIVLVVLVILIMFFAYFIIYKMMIVESKTALVENFVDIANLNYYMVKHSFDIAEEEVRNLSNNDTTKKIILEYLDGEKSLEELKDYTVEEYIAEVESLYNIAYAERIVGEESIAIYDSAKFSIPDYEPKQNSVSTSITFDIDEVKSIILVYSPIMVEDEVIGYDYLVYMIENELDLLNSKKINTGLIPNKEHDYLLEDSKIVEIDDESYVLETEKDFYALYQINDKYFYTSISKSDLFNRINIVVNQIFVVSSIIFISVSVFIYIFIIKYGKNKISDLDESREKFKKLAYFDQLTGAYSRNFLNVWNKNYREKYKLYSIVMIDINDYKKINDTYGHNQGDIVLKIVAQTIMKNLRDTDILVRFGGDEFLIILPDLTVSETKKIMGKIEKQLYHMEGVPSPITISFGISILGEESYEEAIKIIDKLMYKEKRKKKIIQNYKKR